VKKTNSSNKELSRLSAVSTIELSSQKR
jgi:hypothetical protein